jgi:hypothetical protein
MIVRTVTFIVVVSVFSISAGFLVFVLTNMYYMTSVSQGPYGYSVRFYDGVEAKDLGVVVNVNLSYVKTLFVGEKKDVTLEVSAEKANSAVQNFTWRIFWIELFTVEEGRLNNIVAHGSCFLNKSESSEAYLYQRQKVSVGVVNLNYLESVNNAWFRIGIMMSVNYNGTEYSLTSYTPIGELGPVAVLSPLYSSISLAAVSSATIAASTVLVSQHLSRAALISKKKPLP